MDGRKQSGDRTGLPIAGAGIQSPLSWQGKSHRRRRLKRQARKEGRDFVSDRWAD